MDPKTDYTAWKFWLDGGYYLFSAFILLFAWGCNRSSAKKKDMKSMDTRVTKLEAGSISHEDLGKVYTEVNAVSKQVSKLSGTSKSIETTVGIIQEHLLNNGGKG